MIPKIIHYCWFGRGEKPELVLKCIDSWRKYLPEYEIVEWNEDNFNLNLFPYAREAYDSRKFAFVADVVRLFALYDFGGVYFDTDVEVLKPLDAFLDDVAFSGFEDEVHVSTGIMASEKGGKWVDENLAYYQNRHFILPDGSMDMTTNVDTITSYMLRKGLIQNNTKQTFENLITIWPKDVFCPKSYRDGKIYLTDNTVTIHHFAGSWHSKSDDFKNSVRIILGNKLFYRLSALRKKIWKR